MSELIPRLWSDFDGTAVRIVSKINPCNWLKYPLPAIEGYADFLRGVRSTDVEIAGIVSRRPDIAVRRMATARSIAKLGFSEFFPYPDQIVHKGSEKAKGRFVAEQSRATAVGMLEDKPHKLGVAVLLGVLLEHAQRPESATYNPILLGAVNHGRSQEYIERLAAVADALVGNSIAVSEVEDGLSIKADGFSMDVVRLQPFSQSAGQEFGRRLVDSIF